MADTIPYRDAAFATLKAWWDEAEASSPEAIEAARSFGDMAVEEFRRAHAALGLAIVAHDEDDAVTAQHAHETFRAHYALGHEMQGLALGCFLDAVPMSRLLDRI